MMESYASKSEDSLGRIYQEESSPHRSAFQRDRDRILHCGSFRKLQSKTQVFVEHEGDYYRTRLTHTLEVTQIARTIAKVLGVNSELVEAIALAHDLGHPPFGHTGETELDSILSQVGGFNHNIQALRIVTKLEQIYANHPGLNLTLETLEGMITHNGLVETANPFVAKLFRGISQVEGKIVPSVESQIAALSDDIAYNCHDLGDGLRAGFFTLIDISDLPIVREAWLEVEKQYKKVNYKIKCHEVIRRILNALVNDLLEESKIRLRPFKGQTLLELKSHSKPVVAFSKKTEDELMKISNFLFKNMYRHRQVCAMRERCSFVIKDLFNLYSEQPRLLPRDWNELAMKACEQVLPRIVGDYISGMTDRYALNEHKGHFG
ncbi:MAG: deoxyguanosinetriphosphate triphosphohydrolase [Rhodobacteraceae bacterium]|nr:MAG: deoxyguanosinetriphosphate triphosphohydrolase [Paracoccaceae bacterium]